MQRLCAQDCECGPHVATETQAPHTATQTLITSCIHNKLLSCSYILKDSTDEFFTFAIHSAGFPPFDMPDGWSYDGILGCLFIDA